MRTLPDKWLSTAHAADLCGAHQLNQRNADFPSTWILRRPWEAALRSENGVIVAFISQQTFAIRGTIPLSPNEGSGRIFPGGRKPNTAINLHQTFATPNGPILLAFRCVAKLTHSETPTRRVINHLRVMEVKRSRQVDAGQ